VPRGRAERIETQCSSLRHWIQTMVGAKDGGGGRGTEGKGGEQEKNKEGMWGGGGVVIERVRGF
jgi:hypothetical protein